MTTAYPTAIKSFTPKVDNVDDVMASSVNEAYDEITAVETALGANLVNVIGAGGWVPYPNTWTYVSASTFKITGDRTATFKKGLRLSWVQGGATKYGCVAIDSTYSAPDTTVTILVNTDFTIANSAITTPRISYLNNPDGYPGSFNYALVATPQTGSITSYTVNSAKFSFNSEGGKIYFDLTITDKGTGAGYLKVTIPWTIAGTAFGCGRENVVTGFQLQVIGVNAEAVLYIFDYAGATPIATNAVVLGGASVG